MRAAYRLMAPRCGERLNQRKRWRRVAVKQWTTCNQLLLTALRRSPTINIVITPRLSQDNSSCYLLILHAILILDNPDDLRLVDPGIEKALQEMGEGRNGQLGHRHDPGQAMLLFFVFTVVNDIKCDIHARGGSTQFCSIISLFRKNINLRFCRACAAIYYCIYFMLFIL